jgi:hypothetical protein
MYLEKLKSAGASDAEILAANAEMDMFRDMYRSTVTRFLLTLAEIFPTGLLISLISSAILRRKK